MIMKKQNSWLCQIKAWAVLKFSFNKPTQIHLMFLYIEYYCIEKAFFLHHIHRCFSVCLLSQRLSPSWLHTKQGGQQVRERILPLHSAPALGAPAQESHGPVRASLGEHHKQSQGRSSSPMETAWDNWAISSWRKKAPERPHWAFQYLQEAYRREQENFLHR